MYHDVWGVVFEVSGYFEFSGGRVDEGEEEEEGEISRGDVVSTFVQGGEDYGVVRGVMGFLVWSMWFKVGTFGTGSCLRGIGALGRLICGI